MKAFKITQPNQYVQNVLLDKGVYTFHCAVKHPLGKLTIALKGSSGWHEVEVPCRAGKWDKLAKTTFEIEEKCTRLSLCCKGVSPQSPVLMQKPMLEDGTNASTKKPNEADIEENIENAIIESSNWEIRATSPVIYKNSDSAVKAGTHTPVTVSGVLRQGTNVSEGGFITVTASGETEAAAAAASPVVIAPFAGAGKTSYTVRLYDTADKKTLLDTMTIPVVFKGASGVGAVNVVLSNEADVMPAAADGTVSDYTGSDTDIRVFEGATELEYDGSGTANGKYNVTATATGIVAGAKSKSGIKCLFANVSSMTADSATIVFTVTGKTQSGDNFAIAKQQSFAKSKTGVAGLGGLSVIAGRDVVPVECDASGIPVSLANTGLSVSVVRGEKTLWYSSYGDEDYRIFVDSASGVSSVTMPSGYHRDVSIPPITSFSGSEGSITLRFEIKSGSETLTHLKTINYVKIKAGAAGKDGMSIERLYKRTTDFQVPSAPATQQQDDYVPSGWSKALLGVDATNKYVWACERSKINGVWSAYTNPPILWAKWAADGERGLPGQLPVTREWKQGETHRNNAEAVDYIYYRPTPGRGWYRLVDSVTQVPSAPSSPINDSRYRAISSMEELAVQVLIAEEGNLAEFIFKDGWLISQDADVVNGVSIPRLKIDGKRGKIETREIVLDGSVRVPYVTVNNAGEFASMLLRGKNVAFSSGMAYPDYMWQDFYLPGGDFSGLDFNIMAVGPKRIRIRPASGTIWDLKNQRKTAFIPIAVDTHSFITLHNAAGQWVIKDMMCVHAGTGAPAIIKAGELVLSGYVNSSGSILSEQNNYRGTVSYGVLDNSYRITFGGITNFYADSQSSEFSSPVERDFIVHIYPDDSSLYYTSVISGGVVYINFKQTASQSGTLAATGFGFEIRALRDFAQSSYLKYT